MTLSISWSRAVACQVDGERENWRPMLVVDYRATVNRWHSYADGEVLR